MKRQAELNGWTETLRTMGGSRRLAYDRLGHAVCRRWAAGSVLALALALFGAGPALADALYNSTLGVPFCAGVGASCDSGTLLERAAHMSPPEANQPNTMGNCPDGDGTFKHLKHESIERIAVSSLDGQPMVSGSTVRLEVTFHPYGSGPGNFLQLQYTGDGGHAEAAFQALPIYEASQSGLQTHAVDYVLPEGSLHRVRARIAGGSSYFDACDGNGYYEVDDLAFTVAPQAGAAEQAVYDAGLQVPMCTSGAAICDSGALLERSGKQSPPELNHPNTLGSSCQDGDDSLVYLQDESVERIVVSTIGGQEMTPGARVRVDVDFHPYGSGSGTHLAISYSGDGANPAASLQELFTYDLTQGDLQSHSFEFNLAGGAMHRIRARLYDGSYATNCGGSGYWDVDELHFAAKLDPIRARRAAEYDQAMDRIFQMPNRFRQHRDPYIFGPEECLTLVNSTYDGVDPRWNTPPEIGTIIPGTSPSDYFIPVCGLDGDGDQVPDEYEFAFCEDKTDPDCGPLSHQMRLAKLLVYNEQLTEVDFDQHYAEYVFRKNLPGSYSGTQYCNDVAVPGMVNDAEAAGLHPPSVSEVQAQVCRWQPHYTSDRRLAEQDADHCRLAPDLSDSDILLMAQAEKTIGSESGGVCKAFNFLKEAEGLIERNIGPEYNFRFTSLLKSAVLSDVFDRDTADSLRVILGAMFPEQMCELGPAENPALFLREEIGNLASTYLGEDMLARLRGAHWSENRKDAITPGFDLNVPQGYSKSDELRDAAWVCEIDAAESAAGLVSGRNRWSKLARASLRMIFYDLCITPHLQSAVKFSDLQFQEPLQELLDDTEDRLRANVESLNSETDPENEQPDWTVDMDSYLAPFNLFFESDSINPDYLDFSAGGVLPGVVAFPPMHCDVPKPYSELIEIAESTEAAMRSDCVSAQHAGTEFRLYEDQCSLQARILCDVSAMDADFAAITGYFVTERKYPLAYADKACIAEGELEVTSGSITTAYAASDIGEASEGALQNLTALDPNEVYGTGFVVCTEDVAHGTVLENKGLDYVQCATGSGVTTRSAYKRAGASEPLQSLPDTRQERLKRLRSLDDNEALGEAIVEFRQKLVEETKASAGRNRLNHYTLPVGQGSCHIVQCIETPPADASGNVGPLTVNNVVYDCGSRSRIPEDTNLPPADGDFIRWITQHLETTGSRLLAKTLLYGLGNSTTDHVIVSHTDLDHNSMLRELWPSATQVPQNWTLGGRPEDFGQEPLSAMIDRLEAGLSVTANGRAISNVDITEQGDATMGVDQLRLAKIDRLRRGASRIDPKPDGVENLVPNALQACGNATMHLQTINVDMLDESTPGRHVPAEGQEERLNSVSAVVTLEVPDRFLAVLPGDAVHSTWVSVQNNAAANNTALTAGRRATFPVRYLASAHHGSFRYGSNDTLVTGLIQPTHVVFSHALMHRHVHDRAWHAYSNSVVQGGDTTPTLKIKDSSHPDSPAVPTPDQWTGDDNRAWVYKPTLTDVQKKALISTNTNGLIVGTLLFPKEGTANANERKTTFTLRRFSLNPANLAQDFLLGNALFRQDLGSN